MHTAFTIFALMFLVLCCANCAVKFYRDNDGTTSFTIEFGTKK